MYVPRTSSERRNSRRARAQAFSAEDRASRRDHASRRLGGAGRRASNRTTGVPSKIRTPRSTSASPEPAREPGRVDGRGVGDKEARPNDGRVEAFAELVRASAADTRRRAPDVRPPRRSRGPRRRAPGWSIRRGRPTARTRRRPLASSHHAPISSIDRAATRRSAALARRKRSSSRSASSYSPFTNPPLRPLGPPPQMSRSSSTTSMAGSRSLRNHAVHIPVYPPPRITTSAVVSPASGGASGPANSGSASASSSHQLRRAGRGRSRSVNGVPRL